MAGAFAMSEMLENWLVRSIKQLQGNQLRRLSHSRYFGLLAVCR